MTFTDTLPLVWPLTFLVIALFLLRKVEAQVNPIVVGIVSGVSINAKQYALMYAMALLYASAASLQALGEVAASFHWVYVAAFAKVLQPGLVAVIAYVTKPPQFTQAKPDAPAIVAPAGATASPFPPPAIPPTTGQPPQ